MKKLKITFEETVKMLHDVTVVGYEEDIDNALNEIESNTYTYENGGIDDIISCLENNGCKIKEVDLNCEDTTEKIEYYDEIELEMEE
mgnify:CR=1 FL=1